MGRLYYPTNLASPNPLSREETMELFKDLPTNRNKIIEGNLRLAVHITNQYVKDNYSAFQENFSHCCLGLIKAIDSYDCTRGVNFASYACKCMVNEMNMGARKAKSGRRNEFITVSLSDTFFSDIKNGNDLTYEDTLVCEEDCYKEIEDRESFNAVIQTIDKLNDREKFIITSFFGINCKQLTQEIIADKLGISQSFVSRIKGKVLLKLREVCKDSCI